MTSTPPTPAGEGKPAEGKPAEPETKPDGEPKPGENGAGDLERRNSQLLDDLQAERKARKRMEDELAKLRRDGMDETARAIDQAKAEARAEVMAEVNKRVLRSEVIAAAAGKLADPGDAWRLLDLDELQPDDAGNYDKRAISAALDKLVESKPYLAPAPSTPAGGPPKVPQGTRGTPGHPAAGADAESDGDAWMRGMLKEG